MFERKLWSCYKGTAVQGGNQQHTKTSKRELRRRRRGKERSVFVVIGNPAMVLSFCMWSYRRLYPISIEKGIVAICHIGVSQRLDRSVFVILKKDRSPFPVFVIFHVENGSIRLLGPRQEHNHKAASPRRRYSTNTKSSFH
jgi:hypothetical protein